MQQALAVLVLISLSNFGVCFGENVKQLTWPDNYHLRGEKMFIMYGINEPFEIWHQKKSGITRRDVYGGLVNYYYDKSDNKAKYTYTFHFETTWDDEVAKKCYVRPENELDAKMVLPSVKDFVFKGKEQYIGKSVQVWEKKEENKTVDTIRQETVYVYQSGNYHVPVRYEAKSYSLSTKSIHNHHINLYYEFNSSVSSLDVDIKNSHDLSECEDETVFDTFSELDTGVDVGLTFHGFKHLHHKKYNEKEHDFRKTIFEKNLRIIAEHNRKGHSYRLKVTSFTDISDAELLSKPCFIPPKHKKKFSRKHLPSSFKEERVLADDIPEELDLRSKGIVTSVKNQLACGSCWAFGITSTVEGAIALKNGGKLLDLSEQSLVDCAWGYGNMGCNGGGLVTGLEYLLHNGIPSDFEYGPYLMEDGMCHVGNITDTYNIEKYEGVTTEIDLKVALNKYGPVVAAIYAGPKFAMYSSGVFFDPDCETQHANHAVTVIGYGRKGGEPYWLLKNSHGQQWGEAGYMYLAAKGNHCHLLNYANYVVA